jgi:hypothetical protein
MLSSYLKIKLYVCANIGIARSIHTAEMQSNLVAILWYVLHFPSYVSIVYSQFI